jgi:CHAT domain-containing protein/tetratricopeptide (TPR) repeat protein
LVSLDFPGWLAAFLLVVTLSSVFADSACAGDLPGEEVAYLTRQQHAPIAAGEAGPRAVVKEYFEALRSKDWARFGNIQVQRSVEMPRGSNSHGPLLKYNHSLEMIKQLLDPYRIDTLSFTIDEVEIKGRLATVRAKLSIRVREEETGADVIAFNGLERVLRLDNYDAAWKVTLDQDGDGPVAEQIKNAGRALERRFLFCLENLSGLLRAKSELRSEGVGLLDAEKFKQAFEVFELAHELELYLSERAAASAQTRAKLREADAADARTSGRLKDLALNLMWAAQDYAELKDYVKAEDYFADSIKLFEGLGDRMNLALAYMEAAAVQIERGMYPQAISSYQSSIDWYLLIAAEIKSERTHAVSQISNAATTISHLYAAEGKYDRVDEFILRHSKKLESLGEIDEALGLLFVIPMLEMARGENVRAAENIEKLLRRIEQAGDAAGDAQQLAGRMRMMLVLVYINQGGFALAARNIEQIRPPDVDSNVALEWKSLLQFMDGMLYGAQGNEGMLEYRMRSSMPEMMKSLSDGMDVSYTLMAWSQNRLTKKIFSPGTRIGDLPQDEIELLEQSLLLSARLAERSGDMTQAAIVYQLIGTMYVDKTPSRRVEHYLKGLSLLEGAHHPWADRHNARMVTENLLGGLAATYSEMGKHEDAIRTFRRMLSQDNPRLFRTTDQIINLVIAEEYNSLKNYEEAIRYAAEAERIARRAHDRETLRKAYMLAGNAHLALNQPEAARQSYLSAVKEVETARTLITGGEPSAAQFFEDKMGPYQALAELLLSRGDVEGALEYAERGKSKVLLDVLKKGRKDTSPMLNAREVAQKNAIRRRLMRLNHDVIRAHTSGADDADLKLLRDQRVEARLDYELFRAKLYAKYPELVEAPDDRDSFKAEDAYSLLTSPDEAAVEFMVTKEKTYLFVLTREGRGATGFSGKGAVRGVERKVYEIDITEDALRGLINNFRTRISHSDGVVGHRARELYDLLLGQTREQLVGKRSLIIIPDGVLWGLSFQALMPAQGRYLLEDYAISYAPSLTALREMRKVREERLQESDIVVGRKRRLPARSTSRVPTLLAVGDPTTCGDGKPCAESQLLAETFKPLPRSARLAVKLRALYGHGRSRSLSGAEADETTVKREVQGRQVIHIGTHGILDNDNPMYSFLLLSTAGRTGRNTREGSLSTGVEDGFLEAWELMELRLKAELIVLSACDTARGKVRGGEGMVGLSWAALIAGVPTVVVGQWEVDETSTNEMMYDFHKRWLAGRKTGKASSAAEALQEGALTLLRSGQYNHPYYWAGFSVIGVGN